MPQYGRLESRSRHRGPTPCRAIRLFSKIRLRRRWKSIESTSVARHTIPKYLIAIVGTYDVFNIDIESKQYIGLD